MSFWYILYVYIYFVFVIVCHCVSSLYLCIYGLCEVKMIDFFMTVSKINMSIG